MTITRRPNSLPGLALHAKDLLGWALCGTPTLPERRIDDIERVNCLRCLHKLKTAKLKSART